MERSATRFAENSSVRPKLLFFQYKYDSRLPSFILGHMREHVSCLSQFFEVILINDDCDYVEVCEKHKPDLTLVEGSFTVSQARRPRVANPRANHRIPKVGFLHSDAFSQGRAGFLSDMERWDISAYFTISVSAGEHMPAIANRMFVWPNFVDPAIFRDYQQWKSIPVLFTGNSTSLYPWRQNVMRLVSKHYPSLICPHPGKYDPLSGSLHVVAGEPYARMLNASWLVPACGTVARDVVRKHFEVPACKACLVTERSAALEAAGFIDMKNCVFADQNDVLDKLSYLFQHRDKLEDITNAGHELVQSRHTIRQRDQLLQWFNLQKHLAADERIVQTGPFEKLQVVSQSASRPEDHLVSDGFHLTLLRLGDKRLTEGKYEDARDTYYKCLGYVPWMPEPQFRLGLSNLYIGNAKKAESWLMEPIQFTLAEYDAADPDPVEWAYLIVSRLCQGRVEDATRRSNEFEWLRHPELDRVRRVVSFLRGNTWAPPAMGEARRMRSSIHQLPERTFTQWIREICIMLRACGQLALADKVARGLSQPAGGIGYDGDFVAPRSADSEKVVLPGSTSPGRPPGSLRSITRRLSYAKAKVAARIRLADTVWWIENRLGVFMPYHLSGRRRDVFFNAIEELARTQDIHTILIIGAARKACTKALLAGAKSNTNRPSVLCITNSSQDWLSREGTDVRQGSVRWLHMPSSRIPTEQSRIERLAKKNDGTRVATFDMVLIDGSEIDLEDEIERVLQEILASARVIVLDDISTRWTYETHRRLLKHREFVLNECNPTVRGGYSIFEKAAPAAIDANETQDASRVVMGHAGL